MAKTQFLLWPSSRPQREKGKSTEKEKCKTPFSFLKLTSHSERKAMNALAHDPECPHPFPIRCKKKKIKERKKERKNTKKTFYPNKKAK